MKEMYEIQEHQHNTLNTANRKSIKPQRRIWKWTSIFVIWAAIGIGTYFLANHYIGGLQDRLDQMQQTNQQNVDNLNTRMTELQDILAEHKTKSEQLSEQFDVVQSELENVKDEMALAGNSLGTSAEAKKALSQRVTDLSKELEDLRKLIKKLEEAARVY